MSTLRRPNACIEYSQQKWKNCFQSCTLFKPRIVRPNFQQSSKDCMRNGGWKVWPPIFPVRNAIYATFETMFLSKFRYFFKQYILLCYEYLTVFKRILMIFWVQTSRHEPLALQVYYFGHRVTGRKCSRGPLTWYPQRSPIFTHG